MGLNGRKCGYTWCKGNGCQNWLWDEKLRKLRSGAKCKQCSTPWETQSPPWRLEGNDGAGQAAPPPPTKGSGGTAKATGKPSDEELLAELRARGFTGIDQAQAPVRSPQQAIKASSAGWRKASEKLGASVQRIGRLEKEVAAAQATLLERTKALAEERAGIAVLKAECDKALLALEADSRRECEPKPKPVEAVAGGSQAAGSEAPAPPAAGGPSGMEVDAGECSLSEEALDLELTAVDESQRAAIRAFITDKFRTITTVKSKKRPAPCPPGDPKLEGGGRERITGDEVNAARAELDALVAKANSSVAQSPADFAAATAMATATAVPNV